jgi:hypothetical protein
MNKWLQSCANARQTLKSMASMLLDKRCPDLFLIYDELFILAEEAEEKDCCTVVCGLCAASYRLAGSANNIANFAMQTLATVNALSPNSRGSEETTNAWQSFLLAASQPPQQLQQVLLDHQSAVQDFAEALQDDYRNDLMHLTSEIGVLLEHPFVVADDSFHSRLQHQHDALEDRLESLYELGSQLLKHPILGIDAANIVILYE